MAFDLEQLRGALAQHGRVARVVIADVKGSSPREIGASMLVWNGGQSGTIGGGALEFELANRALSVEKARVSSHALGPELGQCCGGAVQIVTEVFEPENLPDLSNDLISRAIGPERAMPLSVRRAISEARAGKAFEKVQILDGWIVEPIARPSRSLWVWGAGHVGRAIIDTIAPIPDFSITWIDIDKTRFPDDAPRSVTKIPAQRPALVARRAPLDAEHLILTYSHALDLELCHQLLLHNFEFAGLIGSKSKWARFRSKLTALGHSSAQISRITCPIGDPSLGKHPQAIAISIGSRLLIPAQARDIEKRITA